MSTHERELTKPVDLCRPDGKHLNPDAKGWSRLPLVRANLSGIWGRTKRWDYWAILTGEGFISLTFADIDYLGLVSVDWADFASGTTGGAIDVLPLGRGIELPDISGEKPLHHAGRKVTASIIEVDGGTRLSANWTGEKGRPESLDAFIAHPEGHQSLNVVIPWSDDRFQFTSKHQARPAAATLTIGGTPRAFGDHATFLAAEIGAKGRHEPPDGYVGRAAWGVLDVGRGRWPYRTNWNWAGGAGTSTGDQSIGIQLGAKWTDGTGFTENGILVDGQLDKIGEELDWRYDWDAPLKPWRVRSADGILDLVLTPGHVRSSKISIGVVRNEGRQVFGRWNGTVPGTDGAPLTLGDDVIGFAEETRAKW